MKNTDWKTKLLFFALGAAFTLGILTMTGAREMRYGGYQISAWSAETIGYGCYILETNTGVTKVVYRNTGARDPVIDNLNKPFDRM